jgi:hypothetical protein
MPMKNPPYPGGFLLRQCTGPRAEKSKSPNAKSAYGAPGKIAKGVGGRMEKWRSDRMTDHKWVPVSARMPHDGQLVVLRMMESIYKEVHHAIERYRGEQRDWGVNSAPKNGRRARRYSEICAS